MGMQPKKGPGQYLDDFLVRRVEGGFILLIEHSEELPMPIEAQPVAQGPFGPVEPPTRKKHQRQIVVKSLGEIVGHLREWTETPAPDREER